MKSASQRLLLIDGMALLFRAFYATAVTGQFMVNTKGMPTNAVQGFMKHLFLAIEDTDPTHVMVCWDMGSKTFRNEMFEGYKSNREAPPIELIPQFDLVKEVVEACEILNIGVAGFEADDCIGTIAKAIHHEMEVIIITGDKDLLQLLDKQIEVRILQKGFGNYKSYTHDIFIEELGVTPRQFIDVKALMGDTSDGYPGVKGIGEKTALKLIQQYEHIDGLLLNISGLSPAQRKKIEADLDMLHLSRKLAEINCEVPLVYSLDHAVWSNVPETFVHFINDLELRGIRRHMIQSKYFLSLEQA